MNFLQKQLCVDEDKIDVLTFVLVALTAVLLVLSVPLFCLEVGMLHKYVYYGYRSWYVLLKRPYMLLLLCPALNFPIFVLRERSRTNQAYRRWTLAVVVLLLVSAVILIVGGKLFFAFYETLP